MKVNIPQLDFELKEVPWQNKNYKLFIKMSKNLKIINKHLIKYFELPFPTSTALFANFDVAKSFVKKTLAGYRGKLFLLLTGFPLSFITLHYQSQLLSPHFFLTLKFFHYRTPKCIYTHTTPLSSEGYIYTTHIPS